MFERESRTDELEIYKYIKLKISSLKTALEASPPPSPRDVAAESAASKSAPNIPTVVLPRLRTLSRSSMTMSPGSRRRASLAMVNDMTGSGRFEEGSPEYFREVFGLFQDKFLDCTCSSLHVLHRICELLLSFRCLTRWFEQIHAGL